MGAKRLSFITLCVVTAHSLLCLLHLPMLRAGKKLAERHRLIIEFRRLRKRGLRLAIAQLRALLEEADREAPAAKCAAARASQPSTTRAAAPVRSLAEQRPAAPPRAAEDERVPLDPSTLGAAGACAAGVCATRS